MAGTALAQVEYAFPQFLKNGIQVSGWPARVTESGWSPGDYSNRDQINNNYYLWQDHRYFVQNTMAGGVAIWLFDYYSVADPPGDCISCAVAAYNLGQQLRQWPWNLSAELANAGY